VEIKRNNLSSPFARKRPGFNILIVVAGAAVGIGVSYLVSQKYFQYDNPVQVIDSGEYSESEEQSYEILKQLMITYFEAEQYYHLCELINMIDSSMADALFEDAGINIYQIESLGRAAIQYGIELDHLGRLSFSSFVSEGIRYGSFDPSEGIRYVPFDLSEDERLQPKVVITENDTFIGTVYGTFLVGHNTIENQSGRITVMYPSDSLIVKANEVRNHFAENHPDLELHMAEILATADIPYSTVVSIVDILEKIGYTEISIQAAPPVMLSRNLSAYSTDGEADRDSLKYEGDLADLLSSRESDLSSLSLSGPTIVDIPVTCMTPQIDFEVEVTGEAIDLGYRTQYQIRRKLNVIKMRIRALYGEHLRSCPGSFGSISVRFSITNTGQVGDVIVTSDPSLSMMRDGVRDAVLLLNYEPVLEQTENVLVEVNFTLTSPQQQP